MKAEKTISDYQSEIEAALDFLARLVERVVELLLIDARNDVEGKFGRHLFRRC